MNRNNMELTNPTLECTNCGKDILEDINNSIIVIQQQGNLITSVYPCCKGRCDNDLGSPNGWKEASDFTNPHLYLKHVMAIFNNMKAGVEFEEQAFSNYKDLLIKTAPYVFRDMDDSEFESAAFSDMLPF